MVMSHLTERMRQVATLIHSGRRRPASRSAGIHNAYVVLKGFTFLWAVRAQTAVFFISAGMPVPDGNSGRRPYMTSTCYGAGRELPIGTIRSPLGIQRPRRVVPREGHAAIDAMTGPLQRCLSYNELGTKG